MSLQPRTKQSGPQSKPQPHLYGPASFDRIIWSSGVQQEAASNALPNRRGIAQTNGSGSLLTATAPSWVGIGSPRLGRSPNPLPVDVLVGRLEAGTGGHNG